MWLGIGAFKMCANEEKIVNPHLEHLCFGSEPGRWVIESIDRKVLTSSLNKKPFRDFNKLGKLRAANTWISSKIYVIDGWENPRKLITKDLIFKPFVARFHGKHSTGKWFDRVDFTELSFIIK